MNDSNNRSRGILYFVELDIIKFLAILLVVLGHVLNFYTDAPLIKPLNSSLMLARVQSIIYSFHMPLFIFVSGCVYGYQVEIIKKQQKFDTFVAKKWKRLMIPYFIFGLLYVAPFMVLWGYRDGYLSYVIDGILLSHDSRHLWYVWALFNIFVLFYVASWLVEKAKIPKYTFLLLAIGCFMVASRIPNVFQLSSSFKYMLWFVMGYELIVCQETLLSRIVKQWGLYFGALIIALEFFSSPMFFPGCRTIYAIGGITFFYSIAFKIRSIVKLNFFRIVTSNSYGLYLFHPILIYLMFHYWGRCNVNPMILSSVIFVLSLFISIGLTMLIRRLKMHFIIGE